MAEGGIDRIVSDVESVPRPSGLFSQHSRPTEMADGCIEWALSDTESGLRNSSLYNRHSQNQVENTSLEVCNIMTKLGYGEEIRRRRIVMYKERDSLVNAKSPNTNITFITAGSKAEGLTCWSESDHDMLFLVNNVLCVEAGIDLHTIPANIEVYRMDTRVYPGHCRMLLERRASKRNGLTLDALCDDGQGNAMLTSGLFVDECANIQVPGVHLPRAGPSLPVRSGHLNFDNVSAIRCKCPSILQRWAERPRYWPAPDVVLKVVSLGSFVTPVGFKGSEYKFFEWRICFNAGETELVNNLNATQAKLYVILKMIVKEVLNPKNKEVTSYVLKNIILWQAEMNSPSLFQEKNVFYWLHDALGTLRTAISCTQLPYYMIPERNLMAACGLQNEQRRTWVADITEMMEEGPGVIRRLPKIRQAVIGHPEPLLWFSRRKMELEMMMLERINRLIQCSDENGDCDDTDIILQAIVRRMDETMNAVCLRMFMEGNFANDIFARILM